MFGKWKPVDVVSVHGDKAEVVEYKDGKYRVREVTLKHE